MGFLDKKEDVLDIQLTQYGKHMLSIGKFRPDHYAFFDDDIIYDSAYGGYDEKQNDSQGRISTGSVSFAAQTTFTGLETEYIKSYNDMVAESADPASADFDEEHVPIGISPDKSGAFPKMQPVNEKLYALKTPIGTSELNNSYAPSWQILAYKTPITGAFPTLTGSSDVPMPTMQIPQIDFTVEFKSVVTFEEKLLDPDENDLLAYQITHGHNQSLPNAFADVDEEEIESIPFADATVLHVKKDYILLEINEKNSKFQNENYDIEVFLVEDEKYSGLKNSSSTLDAKKQILTPLLFNTPSTAFVDGQPIDFFQNSNTTNFFLGNEEKYVENYLDIFVDDDIPNNIFCKAKEVYKKDFLFEELNISCEDLIEDNSFAAYDLPDDTEEICN